MRRLASALLVLLAAACTRSPTPTPTATPAIESTSAPSATLIPTSAPTQTETPVPTVEPATSTSSPTPVTPQEAETSFPALVGNINVTGAPGIVLHRDPAASADVIAVLPGGAIVRALGRSGDGGWIEVVSDQGIAGWVAAGDVYALVDLALLPTARAAPQIAFVPTQSAVVPMPTMTESPVPTATTIPTEIAFAPTPVTVGDVPAMERRLNETPTFVNLTGERIRAIFAAGQGYGNQANVFTTVGDSNTTNGDFLQPIGMDAGAYCTWGAYDSLRETVAYFSVAPANSFTHHSIAAHKGFNSASVLDPAWATGGICAPGETPLLCEYRTTKPSVVVIMLGGIDVKSLTTADYAANMRTIVQTSIQQGVIPVLTTFVVLPQRDDVYERSLEFNMMLLDIAEAEQIPLINLWAAAQTLPNEGIGPDLTHLKAVVGSFCSFDGAQQEYGGTLRNLLTLQALDTLRTDVLTR